MTPNSCLELKYDEHVAINKAINTVECPVKEKHVRTTVLGTFKDHGAGLYWSIGGKLPLQGNPIVAWKFLHVLHKILRDGHQHAIPDSYKNHTILIEMGKMWTHLKEGYGKLIACYCKLLVEKINFHRKNKEIPGNLNLSDEQFAKICGSDVNNYDMRYRQVQSSSASSTKVHTELQFILSCKTSPFSWQKLVLQDKWSHKRGFSKG